MSTRAFANVMFLRKNLARKILCDAFKRMTTGALWNANRDNGNVIGPVSTLVLIETAAGGVLLSSHIWVGFTVLKIEWKVCLTFLLRTESVNPPNLNTDCSKRITA